MRIFIYFPRNCGTHTTERGHHTPGGLGTIRGALTRGADPNDALRAVDQEQPGVRRYLGGATRGTRGKKMGAYLYAFLCNFT